VTYVPLISLRTHGPFLPWESDRSGGTVGTIGTARTNHILSPRSAVAVLAILTLAPAPSHQAVLAGNSSRASDALPAQRTLLTWRPDASCHTRVPLFTSATFNTSRTLHTGQTRCSGHATRARRATHATRPTKTRRSPRARCLQELRNISCRAINSIDSFLDITHEMLLFANTVMDRLAPS